MGIFKSGNQKSSSDGGKTIIAKGCTINGEMQVSGSLHVDGQIDGVINAEQNIAVGKTGKVTGLVQAQIIYLSGCLEGKVQCQGLEIISSGRFTGELVSGELMIERGGKFIGQSYEQTNSEPIVENSVGQIESKKDVKE